MQKSPNPSLAIGSDGKPIVAWEDPTNYTAGKYEIYVRRWNGTSWVEMGTGNGPGGEDTMTKTDYISVYEPVKADFSVSPARGVPPFEVFFENLSSGDYDTCKWDFGGGLGSDLCNDPSVIYMEEGDHTVSLTVKGPGGEDTKTTSQCVKVGYHRIFLPGVMGRK